MWYIEKISLKQRILTGIVGAIISGVLYAAIMFMLEDFIDWSACVFYGFFMGLFFALSLKWKTIKKEKTND